ncbi:MAG: AraC family transcriptional regulator [Pseudomonadota bacterium]
MLASADLLIRGGIIALLIALTLNIVRDRGLRIHLTGRLAIGAAGSFSIYLLATSALFADPQGPLRFSLRLLEAPNLILVWWLILALFHDQFRLTTPYLVAGGAYLALMIGERIIEFSPGLEAGRLQPLFFVASGLIVGHAVFQVLSGRDGDLVAGRRRARLPVIFAILAATVMSVLGTNLAPTLGQVWVQTLGLACVLAVCLVICQRLTRLETALVFFDAAPAVRTDAPPPTHKQAAMLTRLRHLMDDEQRFLTPDLTVAALAREMGVGEHTLRHLINTQLGARNFSSFLNGYRVAFAKTRLETPELRDRPVTTIAMEAGFNSLSAFNRAFKMATGQTPTGYRKAQNWR